MRILIIDDNREITDILKSGLESELFVVDTADEGNKGLKLALSNPYDLIILDVVIPGKNGFEVCKAIRQAKKTTPIIILSVKSEIPDKVELLNIGADDYLTKPFFFAELLARIKALLRRPPKLENENYFRCADLELHKEAHMVTRGNKEIHLTRKEFLILEYLLKNDGKVVTRQMLLENAWDTNADPFSNTIEAHIRNLRKKIDQGHIRRYIQTVPGVGYKIS